MFTRIQARHFRSLKTVDQCIGPFQALVGPNASGKTMFLDAIALMSDLMRNRGDVLRTVQERSAIFENLLWKGGGNAFQLAVEAVIPEHVRVRMQTDKADYRIVRYEVEIGLDAPSNEIGINRETLWMGETPEGTHIGQRELFPMVKVDAPDILQKPHTGWLTAMNKKPDGNDNYYPQGKSTYKPSCKLGRGKSALAHLPADEESFPVSIWFMRLLEEGVQSFALNSKIIRQPSPPGLGRKFQTDGSNLPWVIAELRQDEAAFSRWLAHVRTALEDICDIQTVERPEDRHCYLVRR